MYTCANQTASVSSSVDQDKNTNIWAKVTSSRADAKKTSIWYFASCRFHSTTRDRLSTCNMCFAIACKWWPIKQSSPRSPGQTPLPARPALPPLSPDPTTGEQRAEWASLTSSSGEVLWMRRRLTRPRTSAGFRRNCRPFCAYSAFGTHTYI